MRPVILPRRYFILRVKYPAILSDRKQIQAVRRVYRPRSKWELTGRYLEWKPRYNRGLLSIMKCPSLLNDHDQTYVICMVYGQSTMHIVTGKSYTYTYTLLLFWNGPYRRQASPAPRNVLLIYQLVVPMAKIFTRGRCLLRFANAQKYIPLLLCVSDFTHNLFEGEETIINT